MTKRKGRSAAFMRSINPHLKNRRRSRSRKVFKHHSRRFSMVRRRKAKRSYGRSKGLGVMSLILGVGGYLVFDAIIKPYIPISGMILAIAEIGLGVYLSRSAKPWVKAIGYTAIVLNIFGLMKTYAPSLTSFLPN